MTKPSSILPFESIFVRRLAEIPTFTAVWGTATETYSKLKDSSSLLNYTLESAERSTLFVLDTTRPVLETLSRPIGYVDELACKGLDKVEDRFPSVRKIPEEIVNDAMLYSQQKVRAAKEYGNIILHPVESVHAVYTKYSLLIHESAVEALNVTELMMDRFIPPLETDEEVKPDTEIKKDEKVPLKERFDKVSMKATSRLGQHASANISAVQKYGLEKLNNFQLAMSLLQMMKQKVNSADDLLRSTLQSLLVKATLLKDLAEGVNSESGQNLPNQILQTAKKAPAHVLNVLVSTLGFMSHLPDSFRDAYAKLVNHSLDLVVAVSAITTFDQTSFDTLSQIQDKIKTVKETFVDVTTSLSERLKSMAMIPIFGRHAGKNNFEMMNMTYSSDESDDESSSDS